MKVTKIQQQVKRKDRYSVYIDEKYQFSLSEHQLVGSGLRLGKELTSEELDNFAKESQFGKAYERSINYVMIRPRSQKEIYDYLTRTFLYPKPKSYVDKTGQRHFKPREVDKAQITEMIERVVIRLQEKGYINDETFARSWVVSRQMTKQSSLRKLQQELMVKGIDRDIIATVLQTENINETNNLKTIIAKKQRSPRYQDKTKLINHLLRQGFRYDDIKSAVDDHEI